MFRVSDNHFSNLHSLMALNQHCEYILSYKGTSKVKYIGRGTEDRESCKGSFHKM